MTKEEIERILAVWQERLGLGHWDLKIAWDKPVDDSECEAQIKVSDDYEQASIRIQQEIDEKSGKPYFEGWSVEYANQTIVHELLHVFEHQTRLPSSALNSVLSTTSFEVFWGWYEHGAENWIDRLAKRFVALAGCA